MGESPYQDLIDAGGLEAVLRTACPGCEIGLRDAPGAFGGFRAAVGSGDRGVTVLPLEDERLFRVHHELRGTALPPADTCRVPGPWVRAVSTGFTVTAESHTEPGGTYAAAEAVRGCVAEMDRLELQETRPARWKPAKALSPRDDQLEPRSPRQAGPVPRRPGPWPEAGPRLCRSSPRLVVR